MEPCSIRIKLRVSPGAAQSAVVGRHGDAWKLRIAAAPERGRANDGVVALLARTLDVRPDAVRLVAGASGRDKVVDVEGRTSVEVDDRFAAVQKGAS